jgi:hypothetical protein
MFVEDVRIYMRMPDSLDLSAATFITVPAAEELARFQGELNLSGFTELTPELAQILSRSKSSKLILNGLTRLDSVLAGCLKGYSRGIQLQGLETVDLNTAKALASCCACSLNLEGLHNVELDTLLILIANPKIVVSESLQRRMPDVIDWEVATRFVEDPATVALTTAKSLTDEGAAILAKHPGKLDLRGLVKISDVSSRLLSEHRGSIRFEFSTLRMSVVAAESLARHKPDPDYYPELFDILLNSRITTEVAERISSKYTGWMQNYPDSKLLILETSKAKEISDESAEILGSIAACELNLNSLEHLSDRAAAGLSKFQGRKLTLDGLKTLSMVTVRYLTAFRGELSLRGLENLDLEIARKLAKHEETRIIEQNRATALERRKRESEKIERERVDRIKKGRIAEAELQKEYSIAVNFLSFHNVPYPARTSKSGLINVFKTCLNLNQTDETYKIKIIDIAKAYALSQIGKDQHCKYASSAEFV